MCQKKSRVSIRVSTGRYIFSLDPSSRLLFTSKFWSCRSKKNQEIRESGARVREKEILRTERTEDRCFPRTPGWWPSLTEHVRGKQRLLGQVIDKEVFKMSP